jgi:hypothetical protein
MKNLKSILILLIINLIISNICHAQEIKSMGKTIRINNLPSIIIESVSLIDANHNKLIEAEEACFLDIVIKNNGNGVAKKVNLDVSLDGIPVKGFNYKNSIHAGNLIEGKEYTFQLELYPAINMVSGSARLKIEALEANGFNSKPKYINVNLKSNTKRLAVGWINPLSESTVVYESGFNIKNCIVSAIPVNEAKVYLNGEIFSDSRGIKLIKSQDCDYEMETQLLLRPGVNRVYIEIASGSEKAISETKLINYMETLLESRQALIIGNSDYAVSPLRNPANDAKLMAKTLRDLNFDVIEIIDGDKKQMKEAVRDFSDRLTENKGVGLFYYAGHGIQVKGENYLVPVKHNIQAEADIEDEAIRVNMVLDYMQTCGTRMNIVILDACRDNPFARSMRSGNRGLAQIYAEGSGSLIAYATSPGSVASDGDQENSPFTNELVKAIKTPGLEIGMIFRKVLTNVKKLTDGKQIPWTNSSIEGEFYFKK